MNSIDQKVVEMKFDNSQFESAVSQTMSTLEKFKSKLNFKDTSKGIDKLGKATSEYQYTLQDIGQSLANLEKRFGVMGTVGARIFEKLTDSAYGFVTKGIGNLVSGITQGGMSRAMNLEQAKFQMQGIYKDAQKVHDIIYDAILPELMGTPYSLDQAAVVIGQLGASGIQSAEQVKQATRAISGLAAMSGRGFDEVGRVFSKVAGQGNMMGGELQQLSTYGINAAANIADYFKQVVKGEAEASDAVKQSILEIQAAYGSINEAAIRDAASERMITYEAMASAFDTLYGPHAKKSTEMYTGALEDLKAALGRVGEPAATVRLNVLRDAFNALVPAVDAVNAVLKPFVDIQKDVVTGANGEQIFGGEMYGSLSKEVQKLGISFANLFVQMDINGSITRWTSESIDKYRQSLADLEKEGKKVEQWQRDYADYASEGDAIMNPQMWRTITYTTKGFVKIIGNLGHILGRIGKGFRAAFPKFTLETVGDLAEKLFKLTEYLTLNNKELTRIEWFTRGLFTPLGLAIRGLTSLVGLLARAFRTLWTYISPVVSVLNSLLGLIGRVVSGLGNMIVNFARTISGNLKEATKGFRESEIWGSILSKITHICSVLAQNIDLAGVKIYTFLTHLHEIPAVQAVLTSLGTTIKFIENAFASVTGVAGKFFSKFKENSTVSSIFDKLKDFFSSKKESVAGSLDGFGGFIGKFKLYSAAVDILTGSFGGLIKIISSLPNFKPLKGIRKWFSDFGQLILDLGRSFVDGDFFVDRAKDAFGWFANFKKIGGRYFKNGFVPAIKALGDALPQLLNFKSYGDMLSAIGNKISSAVNFILKTLGLFGTGVVQDAQKGVKNLSSITSSIKGAAHDLGNNKYLNPIIALFDKLTKSLGEWAKNMDVQSAKRLVISLAYFGTCLYYLNTINNAARAFRGLTKIADTVASGIGAIGKMANALSLIPAAIKGAINAFKLVGYTAALSVALLGIASAMFIISQIDPKRLAVAAGVVTGILVVVGGLVWAVNQYSLKLGPQTTKSMLSLAGIIGSLAFAVLAIAASIKLLEGIDGTSLSKAVGAIAGIMVVFGVVMGALALLPTFPSVGDKSAFGNVSSAAWALVGIAAGIRTMVDAIKQLSDIYQNGDEAALEKAVGLVEELIIFTGIFAAFAGWGQHTFASGMGVIAMAFGVKIIIGAIIDIANTLTDITSLNRAMIALKGLEGFVSQLAWLFIAIGIMNSLSGIISKGDFIISGKRGMAGALVAIAEVIAGIWVLGEVMLKLGQLTTAQIQNGIDVLEMFSVMIALISAVSYFGGAKVSGGASSFAALAAGLFLLAEGIVALGETEHFAAGFARMGFALLGLIGSVVLATKLISSFMTIKQAASIALLSAAMLGFALSIRMMAECPWQSLLIAIAGLVGTMAVAALVMTAFSEVGPLLLPIAAAFALLGIAALGFGAGIFLVTIALSTLIPLIIGLSEVPMDKLLAGLDILIEAAKGLTEVFGILAEGIIKLGSALALLGFGLLIVGVGGVVLAASIVACAAAVFLLAGSLIVLYEVLANFFPSVVQPVEAGMVSLVDTFTRGLLDPTVNTVSKAGDEVNATLDEKGTEGEAIAEEKAASIADKFNFFNLMKEKGFEGDMQELAAITGMAPEEMASAWSGNSGAFTGAVDGTVLDANSILSQFGVEGYDQGYNGVSSFNAGILDASSLPIDTNSGMLGKIVQLYKAHEEEVERRGEAQTQKLYGGMMSKEDLVIEGAEDLADDAVPPSRYDDAYETGEGITDGLIAGIRSGSDAVYSIAWSVGNRAAQGAKDGANVNSPSKKTIPVGSAIGEGLIVGMKNISKDVYSTSKDLASKSIDSLTSAMQRTAFLLDSDLDFNPTITPVVDLTNVDQSVNQMGAMFGSAFGVNNPFGARNAAFAASSFADSRNQNDRMNSINKLANRLEAMTDTMNSRSLNNYITIDGASDPEAFADGLIRSFRLNARTV